MPQGAQGFRGAGRVLWYLRSDLLAVVVVAAAMGLLSMVVPLQGLAPVVPLLGIVVSIFIGFRNSNAFNRWWEGRTLWGTVIGNCQATHNALTAVDDCSPEMAAISDRMRRRQVRHAWTLADELRGTPTTAAVRELTPEDPADATATSLLNRQAGDTRDLVLADLVDRQGRTILTNLNTAQVMAAGGLERVGTQPIPSYYASFVRGLAWLFGILVCTRVDGDGRHTLQGVAIGALIMALFVVAERMGHIAERALSDGPFAIPMDDYCARITADLLGSDHPLAGRSALPQRK